MAHALPCSGRMLFGAPASYWLGLRGDDPLSAASQVKAPMLVLQGERDYQVTPEEFAKWKAEPVARRDVAFHKVPGHVPEDVIRDIAAWILAARWTKTETSASLSDT